jgi:hypothetical protein
MELLINVFLAMQSIFMLESLIAHHEIVSKSKSEICGGK